jgi:hypothetical protein
MENFNLKKFLVENKLTTNSKMLNENTVPSIDFGKLQQVLTQASEATNEKGKKLLNGDISDFLEFVNLASTSLENQDTDWAYKVKGTPLLYMMLSSRDKSEDRGKWEKFNEVMKGFSSAFHYSSMNYSPEAKINQLQEALEQLKQYVDSF